MADEETLRDTILTSPSGQRMMNRVSPIYDNSYVALWMFQAIGLEYDKLWDAIGTLREQFFPETATWALELWEQRYGLIGDGTDEERRQKIIRARRKNQPFTPAALESWLKELTAYDVHVQELEEANHFAVDLSYTGTLERKLKKTIEDYILRVKPSHLFFELRYSCRDQITLTTSTWHSFGSSNE